MASKEKRSLESADDDDVAEPPRKQSKGKGKAVARAGDDGKDEDEGQEFPTYNAEDCKTRSLT